LSIKIKGLDEFKKKLDEMQEGLTLPALQHWANKIEMDAKGLAIRIPSEEIRYSIHVGVVEIKPKEFEIKADAKKEAFPFIIEATENNLKEMPLTTKLLFEGFLKQMQEEIKNK